MDRTVQEKNKLSPFFLFFLFPASQIGIGTLNFQTRIAKGAGHDAWLSLLVVGLSLNILFLMVMSILKSSPSGDLMGFHKKTFGKYIGNSLNMILVCYFGLISFSLLYGYIDILQTWAFDMVPLWELTFAICIVVYYIVSGGFRVVTGIAFWGVVIPIFLIFPFILLYPYLELRNMMPFFSHSIKDYFVSGRESIYLFIGFENILIYFPFIKNHGQSKKWGHLGLFSTTLLYLGLCILTFLYYTQGKLAHTLWPTLAMIKLIRFSVLESYEFVFIFTFFLVITSIVSISLWSCTRILKVTYGFKPTRALLGFLIAFFLLNLALEDIEYGKKLSKITAYSGIAFLYGYIPFLFLVSIIKRKMEKKNRKEQL
ncbi:GerAB/ArcD/ProY family transporter [Bacillus sp. EB01]|uniref:GerAB/ArcD/ProY family transporter n=1 Tax=Bacillus sp. EB01 TaxID=1347086 RepID=UPI0005C5C188|nr:GerAB/ArcD/ProY family transporter [Bacillus sp. EB01]